METKTGASAELALIENIAARFDLPCVIAHLEKVRDAKNADSLLHALFYDVHAELGRRALLAGHEFEGVFSWLRIEKRDDRENAYYFVWPDGDDYETYVLYREKLFEKLGGKSGYFAFFERALLNEAARRLIAATAKNQS